MGIWDSKETNDQVDKIVPKAEGVKCFIQNIEFVQGEKISQTRFLLVEQGSDDGIQRETLQNLSDPFSGEDKYISSNLKNFLLLFSALSPNESYDSFKASVGEALGEEFTHQELHDELVKRLDQNYQTIPVEYMLIYPISKGVTSRYTNRPTVGNFIKSKYRNKDLTPFNSEYMSLTPGSGNGKTPDATNKAAVAPRVADNTDF